jgi:hypothetical protein
MIEPKIFEVRNTIDFKPVWYLKDIIRETACGYIAGGCFKDIFSGKTPKDYDIFFYNEHDYNTTLYCVDNDAKWRKKYSNDKVQAFYNDDGITIELNHSIFGKPQKVMKEFDFVLDQVSYTESETEGQYELIYHKNFFEDLQMKRLTITKVSYPLSTFNRALRYTGYGYNLCLDSKIELAKHIMAFDMPKTDDDIEKAIGGGLYNGRD